jgi:hypothetical protein
VADHVADADDEAPGDGRILRLGFGWDVARGFGDARDVPFDDVAQVLVAR